MSDRALITFHGRVQGVGFRASTHRIARGFEVVGTVRNHTDGTVRIDVEGSRDLIERFLDAIRSSRLGSLVTREEIVWGNGTGRMRSFEIQYW